MQSCALAFVPTFWEDPRDYGAFEFKDVRGNISLYHDVDTSRLLFTTRPDILILYWVSHYDSPQLRLIGETEFYEFQEGNKVFYHCKVEEDRSITCTEHILMPEEPIVAMGIHGTTFTYVTRGRDNLHLHTFRSDLVIPLPQGDKVIVARNTIKIYRSREIYIYPYGTKIEDNNCVLVDDGIEVQGRTMKVPYDDRIYRQELTFEPLNPKHIDDCLLFRTGILRFPLRPHFLEVPLIEQVPIDTIARGTIISSFIQGPIVAMLISSLSTHFLLWNDGHRWDLGTRRQPGHLLSLDTVVYLQQEDNKIKVTYVSLHLERIQGLEGTERTERIQGLEGTERTERTERIQGTEGIQGTWRIETDVEIVDKAFIGNRIYYPREDTECIQYTKDEVYLCDNHLINYHKDNRLEDHEFSLDQNFLPPLYHEGWEKLHVVRATEMSVTIMLEKRENIQFLKCIDNLWYVTMSVRKPGRIIPTNEHNVFLVQNGQDVSTMTIDTDLSIRIEDTRS